MSIALLPTLLLAPVLLPATQEASPSAVPASAPRADDSRPQDAAATRAPLAARAVGIIEGTGAPLQGADAVVTRDELDATLLWREAQSPGGQATLRNLLELRVIAAIAAEKGIVVTDAELAARARALDDEAKRAGREGGLAELLAGQGVDRAEFDRYLRLAILHERLTRDALGLASDTDVTPDQQQLWLDSVLKEREYTAHEPPYAEGVVAESGDVAITTTEFAAHLRDQMPAADVHEACYMILLERAVRARTPEIAAAGVEAALDREIERRRQEAESDPRFQGATYESMLEARGLSIDAVRRDPAIRAAALAHEAIDRAYDADGLRAAYEENRLHYDATYGEAVDVYLLWKAAGDDPANPLVPPADVVADDLAKMKAEIESREEFLRALEIHSEDKRSRENGGLLGRLSRHGKSNDLDELRRMSFEALDANPEAYRDVVIGPVRLENGVALAMLGDRRPAPTWETMAQYVHMELRRDFITSSLAPNQVEVVLGQEPTDGGETDPGEQSGGR